MLPSLASPAAAHTGADRCPGGLAVHQARDGGLARIRIPGGALPARVLAALGDWSNELGNGRMELTGRGNLQIRGLAPGAEDELATRLTGHGLLPSPAHDRARNVLASPLSGRDGRGFSDVRALVTELDRRLCASVELAELPGRFLFALDDGRGDVAGLGADATLLGLPADRMGLLLGGRDTGLRLRARAAVSGLLAAAHAFLRGRADERVWRVSELPGGPMCLLPEIESVVGPDARSGDPVVVPRRDPSGPAGRTEQADGRVALAVHVPLGELTAARCRLLAALAGAEVVLTPWRGVLLPDLTPSVVAAAMHRLAGAGLVVDPTAPALGVSACTGRPGCASALADVRADALTDIDLIPGTGGVGLPVHWSACARRCGRPSGPVVDVVAGERGYQVRRDDELLFSGAAAASVRDAAARARR